MTEPTFKVISNFDLHRLPSAVAVGTKTVSSAIAARDGWCSVPTETLWLLVAAAGAFLGGEHTHPPGGRTACPHGHSDSDDCPDCRH
jgi:hypothetical protein